MALCGIEEHALVYKQPLYCTICIPMRIQSQRHFNMALTMQQENENEIPEKKVKNRRKRLPACL